MAKPSEAEAISALQNVVNSWQVDRGGGQAVGDTIKRDGGYYKISGWWDGSGITNVEIGDLFIPNNRS